MKGKIKLPKGFKYVIDRESGEATPTLMHKSKQKARAIVYDVVQSYYLPIKPCGEVLPFCYNWRVNLDEMEINFIHHFNGQGLVFNRVWIADEEGDYHTEFSDPRPNDAIFDAGTNHFTKPKRLSNKILHVLADEVVLPSIPDMRQCFFYLIKKHKSIADKRTVELTEEFLHRLEKPNKIKSDVHRMLGKLSPRQMKDGTIQ